MNVYQVVAQALGCDIDSLTEESKLNQHPNWDSIGHLSVMLALEAEYGITVTDETIMRYTSMASISQLVRSR